jgi:DNA-binding NarL/FixJ family response regulator
VTANPKEARIVLVDDHPLVREHLREAIERESGLTVCGEAESCNEALQVIGSVSPDLAIIDLSLKGSHGLDLIRDVNARYPRVLMLVFSMHDGAVHAERVIRAGANGFITKQEATRKIISAIHTVLAGGLYLSDPLAKQIASLVVGNKNRQSVGIERLTDRELRVFELIGQGYTMRQIGDTLHLDVKTVETYRSRIKEKLNLKDATEVLQYAIRWRQDHASS